MLPYFSSFYHFKFLPHISANHLLLFFKLIIRIIGQYLGVINSHQSLQPIVVKIFLWELESIHLLSKYLKTKAKYFHSLFHPDFFCIPVYITYLLTYCRSLVRCFKGWVSGVSSRGSERRSWAQISTPFYVSTHLNQRVRKK